VQRSFWSVCAGRLSSRSLGGSAIPRSHRVRRWPLTALLSHRSRVPKCVLLSRSVAQCL